MFLIEAKYLPVCVLLNSLKPGKYSISDFEAWVALLLEQIDGEVQQLWEAEVQLGMLFYFNADL